MIGRNANNKNCTLTYSIADIDQISHALDIPWKPSKNIPFPFLPTFIGITWDLKQHMVALVKPKRKKYLNALQDWSAKCMHTLHKVQKLLRKLTHAVHDFLE